MSKATEKPFGIRGTLFPKGTFKDVSIDIPHDGMFISVHDEIFEVGFDTEKERGYAEEVAQKHIESWSFRNNIKATSYFCQSWRPDIKSNKVVELNLHEELHVSDRVITTTVTTKGLGYIIKPTSDSYSFENDTNLLNKNTSDRTLSLVLKYFHDEVLGADRPKVGIYRIIEELERGVGSRDILAKMVGEGKKYITDIRQTTQEHRHTIGGSGGAKVILSEQECIDRTRKLMQAYINSII